MYRASEVFDASRETPFGNFILIMIVAALIALFICRMRTERARQRRRAVRRVEQEYQYAQAIRGIVQEGINNVQRRQRR